MEYSQQELSDLNCGVMEISLVRGGTDIKANESNPDFGHSLSSYHTLKAGSDFEGADGLAEEAILEIADDYEPWAEPWFEPPSGEIESLLFGLQAAIGAGFIGYFIAYSKFRKERAHGA